jgi:hypothetical protein
MAINELRSIKHLDMSFNLLGTIPPGQYRQTLDISTVCSVLGTTIYSNKHQTLYISTVCSVLGTTIYSNKQAELYDCPEIS